MTDAIPDPATLRDVTLLLRELRGSLDDLHVTLGVDQEADHIAIRKAIAAELMELHDKGKRVVQPGLYMAALHLDPDIWPV